MPYWGSQDSEMLNRIESCSALEVSFHASIYRISQEDALIVFRQPIDRTLPSPYSTKDSCLIWFPSNDPDTLYERLTRQLQDVKRIYLAHMVEHAILPVRVCRGPLQFTQTANRRLTSCVLLEPSLTQEEWLAYGNNWMFQVLVNCDNYLIFTESDVDELCKRLLSASSFFLSVGRYEGDIFDMLCDHHGCSVSYINFSTQTKLFSINEDMPKTGEYVERYVEEIDEETEEELRSIIPKEKALSILCSYLRSGEVSGLQSDPEFDIPKSQ